MSATGFIAMVPLWQSPFTASAFSSNEGNEAPEVLRLAIDSIGHAKAQGVVFPAVERGIDSAGELKATAFFDPASH